jgi:hypothetical protein
MIEISDKTACRKLGYNEAWLYCLTLNHNGHKDWRMPAQFDHYQGNDWPTSTWVEVSNPNSIIDITDTFGIVPVRTID